MNLYLYLCLLLFVAESTVMIVQPRTTDFEHNRLKYWYGNFGEIHYGKAHNYALEYVDESLCPDQPLKTKHFKKPTYVLTRGDLTQCSFPLKAITAQKIGAKGIIFGTDEVKYFQSVVLADDGHGRNVHIPTLFVSVEDAQKLKDLKNPQIKVKFETVKKEISNMTLFLSATDRENYIFLRNFQPYFEKIQNYMNLHLVYHTFECEHCSQDECILNNKFCSYDFDSFHPGHGKFIVNEQYRQFNLFKELKKEQQLIKWFSYMNKFDEECDNDWINSEECSKRIMQSLGVHKNMNSGNQAADMERWRKIEVSSGIYNFPEVTINGIRHYEQLTPSSVFNMFCSSLTTPPEECKGKKMEKQSSIGLVFLIIGCSAVFLIMGLYCYRRMIRREISNDISSKVNQLVSKYVKKVSEQKKKKKQKLMEKMTEEI